MIYFTADPHFCHKAILDFEKRPFQSIEDMNEEIIKNWNDSITNKDEVYIIGDLSFGSREETINILKRLQGKKYLICGNHDRKMKGIEKYFVWIKDYYKLRYNKQHYILFHYPIYSWDGKEKGYIHLHGHTHKTSHGDVEMKNKINVGMDLWGYRPISIETILIEVNK